MSMPDLQTQIANTLLPPDPTEPLKAEIAALKAELAATKNELWTVKIHPNPENAWEVVLAKLIEARGDTFHDGHDTGACIARVRELVTNDTDACWTPDREYAFWVTYRVKVSGTVVAATEDDARDHIHDHLPNPVLPNYIPSTLSDVDVYDVEIDHLDVEVP